MQYALLSDVHGKTERLRVALDDARRRGAHRIIALGDIGSEDAYTMLRAAGALGVFGNWEVSGLKRLASENRTIVAQWPAVWDEAPFLAAHAVPYLPAELAGAADVARYMHEEGAGWRDVFPYLTDDVEALWKSFAELAARGRRILFHGHTHVQSGWRLNGEGRLQPLRGPRPLDGVRNDPSALFVIGVGSVGLPDDGDGITYTWYDSDGDTVEWIRLR